MVCIDKSEPGRTVWRMVADERFGNPVGHRAGRLPRRLCRLGHGRGVGDLRERPQGVLGQRRDEDQLPQGRAASAPTLTCTAYVISGGRRAAFVEAEVVDDDGRLVAKASSTYILTPRTTDLVARLAIGSVGGCVAG